MKCHSLFLKLSLTTMKYIADLHIHSKFSRATSRKMVLDTLAYRAKIKGIRLLATGDFTHPEWLFLLKQKLEPQGNGFFRLKNIVPSNNEYLKSLHPSPEDVSFILSTEISSAELKRIHPERISLGVERMRKGAVKIVPGHDGCFGDVNLFEKDTLEEEAQAQLKLF